ncbi:bactofilin family protein [Pelagirhabdus alkalitolerans]|nr:polymer-forming cytoskeletal protein [Pelagirhabdus alkalitolerans]
MLKEKKQEKSIETVIGKEAVIEGDLTLSTSVRIDGKITGNIHSKGDVYIGKSGVCGPKITAKRVIVSGEVSGDITSSNHVYIKTKGKVSGTVISKGIVIEEGGIFNGHSRIEGNDPKHKESS